LITAARVADTVRLDAADGSWAVLEVPWPPLADGEIRSRRCSSTRSKVGRRHVQGRAKAGGWSQQRFARRRENQARDAYAAAADAAARLMLPVLDTLDGLVTGGDRRAVAEILRDSRLRPLAELPRGRFLAVPEPRQRTLEQAAEACRRSGCTSWTSPAMKPRRHTIRGRRRPGRVEVGSFCVDPALVRMGWLLDEMGRTMRSELVRENVEAGTRERFALQNSRLLPVALDGEAAGLDGRLPG
jgi:hypothetical protein